MGSAGSCRAPISAAGGGEARLPYGIESKTHRPYGRVLLSIADVAKLLHYLLRIARFHAALAVFLLSIGNGLVA